MVVYENNNVPIANLNNGDWPPWEGKLEWNPVAAMDLVQQDDKVYFAVGDWSEMITAQALKELPHYDQIWLMLIK